MNKYQLWQMDPRDALLHEHRAVYRRRWTLSVTKWTMSSVESRAGFKGAGANWAVAQGLHKKTVKMIT